MRVCIKEIYRFKYYLFPELDDALIPETLPVFQSEHLIGPLKNMQGIKQTTDGLYEAWIRGKREAEIGPLPENQQDRKEISSLILIGIYNNPYTAHHHRREFLESNLQQIFGDEQPDLEQLDTVL